MRACWGSPGTGEDLTITRSWRGLNVVPSADARRSWAVLVKRNTRGDDRNGQLSEEDEGSDRGGAVGDPGSPQYPTGRRAGRKPARGHGRSSVRPRRGPRAKRDGRIRPATTSSIPTRSARAISPAPRRAPPTTISNRSARSCTRCSGGRPARPISSPPRFPSPGLSAVCRCRLPICRISMPRSGPAARRSR